MSHQTWLEEPYEAQAEHERHHEEFQESESYDLSFSEWLDATQVPRASQGPYVERRFQETPIYAQAFEDWMAEGLIDS